MRRPEAGYSLVAMLAMLTITAILMSAALPAWRYLIKNDREEELLFRGGQIADAIQSYQGKNGNALPTNLDMLVKGHYLRRLYRDPMAPDGRWRLVHQGEGVPGAIPGGGSKIRGTGSGVGLQEIGEVPGSPAPSTQPPSRLGAPAGTTFGPIIGVASFSKEKSLRLFNGRSRYNEWLFIAGQPRVVGRQMTLPPPIAPGATPQASATPPSAVPTPPPEGQ